MKKILIIAFLIRIGVAQELNILMLSNPAAISGSDQQRIVTSINNIPKLKMSIIFGNLTKNGIYEELTTFKEIFDNLELPYFVLPGPADLSKSPAAGIFIKELWKDDKFVIRDGNMQVFGLNVLQPWDAGTAHFKPEDLNWLKNETTGNSSITNQVFFSYYGLNSQINNWQSVINKFKTANLSASVGTKIGKKYKPVFEGLPQFEINDVSNSTRPNLYILRIEPERTTLLQVINDSTYKRISEINVESIKLKNHPLPAQNNYDSKTLWTTNLGNTVLAEAAIYKDRIIAADFGGLVTCIDSTGKTLWDYDAYGDVACKPAAINNTVAIATLQGDLNIINLSNGSHQQTIGFDEALTSDLIIYKYSGSKKIISTGYNPNLAILAGTSGGTLHCYDLETLQEIWNYSGTKNLIRHQPIKIGTQVIFSDIGCNIFSLNADEGWLIWKWSPDISGVTLKQIFSDGKDIFIKTSTGTIAKIDGQLGKTIWIKSNYKSSNSIQLFDQNSKLLVKYDEKKLFMLSAQNGKQLRSFITEYGTDVEPATMTEIYGKIYFSGDNSILYKLDSNIKITKIFDAGSGKIKTILPFVKDKILIIDNDGIVNLLNVK